MAPLEPAEALTRGNLRQGNTTKAVGTVTEFCRCYGMKMDSEAPAVVKWNEGPSRAGAWFPTLREAASFVVEQLNPAFRHRHQSQAGVVISR